MPELLGAVVAAGVAEGVEEGVDDPLVVDEAEALLEADVEAEAEEVWEAEEEALLLPLVLDTAAEEEPVLEATVAVPVAPEITKRGEKLYLLGS